MDWLIGIDFDNTLVSYDELFYQLALERGLIPSTSGRSKRLIRDHVRRLPDGEGAWQRLQAAAYGPRMAEARLRSGVEAFLERCRQDRIRVCIISHKTAFAGMDETRTDLRAAALAWMRQQKFFETDGLGLAPTDVYFEATRRDKIARIDRLGCTHFIDDLEETFLESTFPVNVQKILYAPDAVPPPNPGVKVVSSWREIDEHFFHSSARS